MDPEGAARSGRRACAACRSWPASAATSSACRPTKSASSTNSRPRARATSSTASSRAIWPRRCSASTASSAISRRPTRRARPTSCSTICSARRPACRAPGAMRSAAWARSPRRWREACREAGVDIVLNTPVERNHRREGPRGGRGRGRQERGARRPSSPGSIPSCCSTGWCPRARSSRQVEQHFDHWGCESATFRMNVALDKLPELHRRCRRRATI